MERKIGEIFEYGGEWYQCVKNCVSWCASCDFRKKDCNTLPLGPCDAIRRSDKRCAIFKKLEPVGDPYPLYGHIVQRYVGVKFPVALTEKRFINCNEINNTIDIEVKQDKENTEDMAGLMPVATTNTKGLAPAYFAPLRIINGTTSAKLYEICTLEEYTSVGLLVAIKQYTSKCYIACISANRHNTSGQILYATNEFLAGDKINVYINKTTNKLAVGLPSYFSLYVLPLSYNGNVKFNLTETTDDGYVLVE